jgi:hypothetical protein
MEPAGLGGSSREGEVIEFVLSSMGLCFALAVPFLLVIGVKRHRARRMGEEVEKSKRDYRS